MNRQRRWPANRLFIAGSAAAGLLCGVALLLARHDPLSSTLQPLWVQTVSDIPYGPFSEDRLDLMRQRWSLPGKRPAVLVFHGGGWLTGNRNDVRYGVCARWVKMGFLVANADYRLGTVPLAAEDAIAALRWFSSAAQSYGADSQRIVVTGVSAGATLALLAAFQSGVPVAAVVNFYAPTDLEPLLSNPQFQSGVPPGISKSIARGVSPLTWVRPGLAPVFSVYGADDKLVPPSQSALLTRALHSAGGEADELVIEGGQHGFSRAQADAAYRAVAEFLRRRGIIQP